MKGANIGAPATGALRRKRKNFSSDELLQAFMPTCKTMTMYQ